MECAFPLKKRRSLSKILVYAALVLLSLFVLFPLYLTLLTACKLPMDARNPILSLPEQPTLKNFHDVITKGGYFTALGNSVYVTVLSTFFAMLLNTLLSYCIARNERKKFFGFSYYYFITGIFIPFQVVMIPLAVMARSMNLLNTNGLCLLYVALSFSTNVFLITGFVKGIPYEVDEAAKIDGCGMFRCFYQIILPMMKPIVATCTIMAILGYWNDFSLPLIILQTRQYRTLPLFIYNYRTKYLTNYALVFAAYTLSMLPPLICYLFAQKQIVAGITAGAVKG